jgi:uncharacterized damage-inducible protein DinB
MDLHREFNNAFQGKPWHGKSAMEIVELSDPEKVFVHWIPNAHSIAELVLHLTVWTEEAVERLSGGHAKVPLRGDWPGISETSWESIVEDFRAAHQKFMERIENFSSLDWQAKTIDDRNELELTTGTYAELVSGIIQHLAYHAGQISLLQKF